MTLSGHVEVDGASFGGHVRRENPKEDRIDRRLAVNQTGKRRVVVAMRERGGRVLPFVVAAGEDAVAIVRKVVAAAGSTIYADEAAGWDALHATCEAKRVNHSFAFSDEDACTNQAEATSRGCGGRRSGFTTGSASTSASMPPRWRGARITGARPTGRGTSCARRRRSAIRY